MAESLSLWVSDRAPVRLPNERQAGWAQALFEVAAAAAILVVVLAQLPAIWRVTATPPVDHAGVRPAVRAPAAKAIPSGLQAAIATTLGGDGLRQRFAPDGGLHVSEESASSTSWSLVPVSLTRARVAVAPRQGAKHSNGGQTTYDLGPFSAYYARSAAGIEQGFTIRSHLAGSGPLSLMLSSSGSLHPVSAGPSALDLLDRGGRHVLTYGGLEVTDATGRVLRAHLAVRGSTVNVVADDRGAVYPLHVDPLTQQAELTASDGLSNDEFGISVALSGTTALVGAFAKHDLGTPGQGKAYIFTSSGSTWTQQAELTDGASGDEFGISVALSGTTALVGASLHTVSSHSSQGAAYVFTASGGTWSQQAELTSSDGAANDDFGTSVALSGTTALVGAPFHQVGSNSRQGAAYVFTGSGSTWTQQAELTAGDGATNDAFGTSVALSGTTALVGATSHKVGSNAAQGAAYVFTASGASWTQQAELTASDGAASDLFGTSVALSGTTSLVGARRHQVGSNAQQGAAYVFTASGGTWSQQAELTSSDGSAGDGFATSVVLSGTTALVGSRSHQVGSNSSQGAAYVFTASGGTWSQQAELTSSDGATNDAFGTSVALSGTTALVGAQFHQVGSNVNQGAAYVFATPPTPPTATPAFAPTSVPLGGASTLTVTVANPDPSTDFTGVGFSDALPSGLVVASSPSPSTTCPSGTVTATAGSGTLSLSGATVAHGASCTVSASVEATSAGSLSDSVAASSNEAGTGPTASATLTVIAPPTLATSFTPASIATGTTSSLGFTATNANASNALSGIAFSDTLPSGMTVASPNGLSGSCGGTVTAMAGSGSVSLGGGMLSAASNCSFSLNVTDSTPGSATNTTGAVTSTEGGTGTTASATLSVEGPPSLALAYTPTSVAPASTSSLGFTFTNPAHNPSPLSGVGTSVVLPSGLSVPDASTSACGGTVTTTASSGTIALSGATVASTCTFSVTVTTSASGSYPTTSSAPTSTNGGAGSPASATLSVLPGTTTTLHSSANPSVFGQGVTVTASVAPTSGSGTPTGSVQFALDGTNLGSPVAISGGQATSPSLGAVSVGTHTVTAGYSGDATFAASSGTLTAGQVVDKAATSLNLEVAPNPSPFGQNFSVSATVSALSPGSGVATGNVQFQVDGSNVGSPVPLTGGQATLSTGASLAPGPHTMGATYSGDPDFEGSSASSVTKTVSVPAPTQVLAAAGVGSATVSWSGLAGASGETFILTSTDLTTGAVLSPLSAGGATTLAVSGLSAGDAYSFTVTGTISGITSVGSSPSNRVVPTQNAPTDANTGSGSASIGTAGTEGSISATTTGGGPLSSITVAQYPSNPTAGLEVGGSFFDVLVRPGSTYTSVTVTLCGKPTATGVQWWNPLTLAYQPVSGASAVPGQPGCFSVTFDPSSTPTLAQLYGTVLALPSSSGYWTVAADGGVFAFGVPFYGSMGGRALNAPVVGMASTPDGAGYVEVAADGGVFCFGAAAYYGSLAGRPLSAPIVGIALTPDGRGYWEVARDGGVFTFGDAAYYGSRAATASRVPIVAMSPTADGNGYVLVGAEGTVYAFGSASGHGSVGANFVSPIVGAAITPSGGGYHLVSAAGGIYAFGDAAYEGSMGGHVLNAPVVGLASLKTGGGYFEVATDGGVFAFGAATFAGSMVGQTLNAPVVGMASAG